MGKRKLQHEENYVRCVRVVPTRLSVCVVEVKEISEGLQRPGTEHHQSLQTGLGALRGGEGRGGSESACEARRTQCDRH